MKPENERSSDQLLHKALGEWLVKDLSLPPRFQEQVWHRIELIESQTTTGLLGQLVASILSRLAKPSLALSYLVVLLLVGLLAGYFTAHSRSLEKNQEPELAWLQREFHLDAAEFARICQMHEAYRSGCSERCHLIDR